ncbi:MAG: hypothetical protein KA715_06555 [Xanthomonadaceae bacterium]|nr:hypothetical protein [Xanthomonadaceae bacterium]
MKPLKTLVMVGLCFSSTSLFAGNKILSVSAETGVARKCDAEMVAIKYAKIDVKRLATEACEDSPTSYWWGLGHKYKKVGDYKIVSNCIYNVPYCGFVNGVAKVTFNFTCNE